jgi:nitrous oxidase accessory protein
MNAAVLAVLAAAGAVVPAPARDLVVDPQGSIRSVATALTLAAPGDRIIVRPGVYREPRLVIDKRIELIGEGDAVLDGGGTHEVLTVRADSVIIRGLTIRNVGTSYTEDRAGIRLDQVNGCVVENNRLEDTFFGIYVAKSTNCRITGNRLEGTGTSEVRSGNGIHLWYSSAIHVERNEIHGHRDGIYLEFSEGAEILRNLSSRNIRYGLHFMFSNGCRYVSNSFIANGAGVAVMYSRDVTIKGNRFEQSTGAAAYGLLLKDLGGSVIEANRFADNTVGIFAEGTTRSMFRRNVFSGNGWAVRLMGDATDNRFERNRFERNTFDVATNSFTHSTVFAGNQWDRYEGYDLNRDGRGDVPFHPVRLFAFFVEQYEPSLILLRSPFVQLLELAERAFPVLTPPALADASPVVGTSR